MSQPETKPSVPAPAPVQSQTMEPKPVSSVPQPSKIDNSSGENLIDIEMPKMGESVMEGTIIKWYKKQGTGLKRMNLCLRLVPIRLIPKSHPP